MCNDFHHQQSSNPAVKDVEGIEADPEQRDENIIPTGKDDKGHHVDKCQMPRPSSDLGIYCVFVAISIVEEKAVDDVAYNVQCQEYRMKS